MAGPLNSDKQLTEQQKLDLEKLKQEVARGQAAK